MLHCKHHRNRRARMRGLLFSDAFAAQLWAVKMADVGWQKAVSGGFTVS